ncbi:MAG: aldose 1-epimerase [Planctomycetota bacterium]|nr:aldose 1-epimerase [Planctomycetota bacterium]
MESIVLKDSTGNSVARILPGFGFNLYSLEICGQEILWSASEFHRGTARASGSGIPILYPFPGRLPGKTLRWKGREYEMDCDDGAGNAIHGFVLDRKWRVVDQQESKVTGEFHASIDAPELLTQWPGDFRIQCQYELHSKGLSATYTLDNPGEKSLPCGLGTHPYFRVPVGGEMVDDCILKVPVQRHWVLEEMLTTGEQRDANPVFADGVPLDGLVLDDVFSGVVFDAGIAVSAIEDPNSGQRLTFQWDEACRCCVVYIPPHREAICIEPYSLVPGGYAFDPSAEDGGLMVLEPGERTQHCMGIELDDRRE